MKNISYSQNFEDILLLRALSGVDAGFYVDVGAQDPVIDSVTKLFYEKGWRGINIEPVSHWHARLCEDRPRDTNLRCAASAVEGRITLHEVAESGLSTSSDEFAERHARSGRTIVDIEVPALRLDDILAKYAEDPIHFLKVDVEGMESEVLAGLSLDRFRPWILLIEATEPNSTADTSQVWEPGILSAGYRFAHHDGLNRYYVAAEHAALAEAFRLPPNVFDNFVLYGEVRAEQYARSLESRLHEEHIRAGERAAAADAYRQDLLAVTEAAENRARRISELDGILNERQARLEELATTCEKFRSDLLVVHEAAENRGKRIAEIEAELARLDADSERMRFRAAELGDELRHARARAESTERERDVLRQASSAAEAHIREITGKLEKEHAAMLAFHSEVELMKRSRSWRMTQPLRDGAGVARDLLRAVLAAASRRRSLRAIGRLVMPSASPLRRRLLRVAGYGQASLPAVATAFEPTVACRDMTSRGSRVYALVSQRACRQDRND